MLPRRSERLGPKKRHHHESRQKRAKNGWLAPDEDPSFSASRKVSSINDMHVE